MNPQENLNTERERSNLLSLLKLTLNTLIDQSSSSMASPVLDDRSPDVINFILTLERILNFRMRPNWLSERRFFWDFVRPACIGSGRSTIIERVEEVSKAKTIKEKGRIWIKFALMEKKLSELLKLVISDCHLVRKFYFDDAIMISSQAFIICDQLAGLNAVDFSFCFKQDGSIFGSEWSQQIDLDVIDITPFLCYKSKILKQFLKEQNNDDENRQPMPILSALNELKPLSVPDREMVPMDKYKLEVEQRKYFEELFKQRDREHQDLKKSFERLKSEREKEVVQMENVILELQLQLATKMEGTPKVKLSATTTETKSPIKSILDRAKEKIKTSIPSPTQRDSVDVDMTMIPETMQINETSQTLTVPFGQISSNTSSESLHVPSELSRRSSISTTASQTEDDQYEMVRHLPSESNPDPTSMLLDTKAISSPELLSSATSLASSLNDQTESSTTDQHEKPVIQESGHFEPVEITAEQAHLLAEATTTT